MKHFQFHRAILFALICTITAAAFISAPPVQAQGEGFTQDDPILPDVIDPELGFFFFNVPSDRWFDPPATEGFWFTLIGGTEFTQIADFPVGFDAPFTVWAEGRNLGEYSPGDSLDFTAFFGRGVWDFQIRGIEPTVDSTDPVAFPIKLVFDAGRGDFIMAPIVDWANLDDMRLITGTILFGYLWHLQWSDDAWLQTASGFGESLADLHNMEMAVSFSTTNPAPVMLDVLIKSFISEPSGTAIIALHNWTTDQFDVVGQHALGQDAETIAIENIDAADYVDSGGEIELSIKHIVFVPFLAFQFESWIDRVGIAVR